MKNRYAHKSAISLNPRASGKMFPPARARTHVVCARMAKRDVLCEIQNVLDVLRRNDRFAEPSERSQVNEKADKIIDLPLCDTRSILVQLYQYIYSGLLLCSGSTGPDRGNMYGSPLNVKQWLATYVDRAKNLKICFSRSVSLEHSMLRKAS